jgi:ribosomal protein S18 acetylase RimI-like enzyme
MEEPQVVIRQVESPDEEDDAARLMAAYLRWGAEQLRHEYGVGDAPADAVDVRAGLDAYRPPAGRLLVAYSAGEAVGVGALRRLQDGAGEIKRMYVVPEARSLGIGSRLLDALLHSAQDAGIGVVRLDTAGFMTSAHRLYRSRGFIERSPYEGTEIPEDLHDRFLFFERRLRLES